MIAQTVKGLLAVVFSGVLASCGATMSKDTSGININLAAVDSYIDRDQPFLLKVSLLNNTSEPLRYLPWGTPFEGELSADCFDVFHDGQRLPYIGRMIKRMAPREEDYRTLASTESLDVLLDLTRAYAVNVPGEYTVRVKSVGNVGGIELSSSSTVSIKRNR